MSLSTQYSTGAYVKPAAHIKAQSIVEIRFSDNEISEPVAVYPQVGKTGCEVSNGRVNYSGRLICTLIYLDGDGKLCRVQKGAEFSHYADEESLAPAMTAHCALSCERWHVKRDGSSFVVGAVVGAEINVYAPSGRSCLSSAEGASIRRENVAMYSTAPFTGEGEVEDSFDCNAQDVLVPAAEASVTSCTCRAGEIEICGEIYLTVLAVREGSPVCFDRTIPYKCEIPCEESLIVRPAQCAAEIKDLALNARVDEDGGNCRVEFGATLCFSGYYCDSEEISAVTDAFSCTNAVECIRAEETAHVPVGYKNFTQRVSGLCATKAKLDYSCSFLAVTLPRCEYTRTECGIEGSVTAVLLYDKGGEIKSTEVNLPFVWTADGGGEVKAYACGVSVKQRAEGECEAEATLKISVAECETHNFSYLSDLKEGGELPANRSAVSVYVPSAGDGLWETAKKLRRPPEDIQLSNPELVYPLTGKERIVVFRGKTN